jgi:hypothetical protein
VMSSANLSAILGLGLMLLISSGVALGQDGNAGPSNPGYTGASAVNPNMIDDATVKQPAKAYRKGKANFARGEPRSQQYKRQCSTTTDREGSRVEKDGCREG